MSLTEFNQNPSRATKLAENGEVLVLRRGVPVYRLERVREQPTDPVEALLMRGILSAPRRGSAVPPRHLPVSAATADVGAALEADRGRLNG